MTGTTHALVGAAIGALLRRPWPALAAGVVSHGLLDLLPHQDYVHTPPGLLLDGIGVLGVLSLARRTRRAEALVGALGGMLPDLEHARGGGNPHPPTKVFPSHWVNHERGVRRSKIAAELFVAAGALLLLRFVGSLGK